MLEQRVAGADEFGGMGVPFCECDRPRCREQLPEHAWGVVEQAREYATFVVVPAHVDGAVVLREGVGFMVVEGVL